MAYVTTAPVKALSTGIDKGPGEVIHQGEIPAPLWQRLIDAGTIVDADLEQLRADAKAAGVAHYWLKSAETLRRELNESATED